MESPRRSRLAAHRAPYLARLVGPLRTIAEHPGARDLGRHRRLCARAALRSCAARTDLPAATRSRRRARSLREALQRPAAALREPAQFVRAAAGAQARSHPHRPPTAHARAARSSRCADATRAPVSTGGQPTAGRKPRTCSRTTPSRAAGISGMPSARGSAGATTAGNWTRRSPGTAAGPRRRSSSLRLEPVAVAEASPRNSSRLGSYFTLDLRAARHFAFERSLLTVYLEVTNATNRQQRLLRRVRVQHGRRRARRSSSRPPPI